MENEKEKLIILAQLEGKIPFGAASVIANMVLKLRENTKLSYRFNDDDVINLSKALLKLKRNSQHIKYTQEKLFVVFDELVIPKFQSEEQLIVKSELETLFARRIRQL